MALNKLRLAEVLLEGLTGRNRIRMTRPILRVLDRVRLLAARNPLPVMQETWELNQRSRFLGKKRKA